MEQQERRRLALDLRSVCMRISRRSRFENVELLPPHHFSVLWKLQHQMLTCGQLAEAECVSAPSMSRTVNGVVDAGYVERVPDEHDGRRTWLRLTPKGQEALDTARASRDRWMTDRIDALTDEECDHLARATEILAKVVDR